jgi:hypothetical protein
MDAIAWPAQCKSRPTLRENIDETKELTSTSAAALADAFALGVSAFVNSEKIAARCRRLV